MRRYLFVLAALVYLIAELAGCANVNEMPQIGDGDDDGSDSDSDGDSR